LTHTHTHTYTHALQHAATHSGKEASCIYICIYMCKICCSVSQRFSSVVVCVAGCCSVLQGVAGCCRVLLCILCRMCCSVLQCFPSLVLCVASCCSELQHVAACCCVCCSAFKIHGPSQSSLDVSFRILSCLFSYVQPTISGRFAGNRPARQGNLYPCHERIQRHTTHGLLSHERFREWIAKLPVSYQGSS